MLKPDKRKLLETIQEESSLDNEALPAPEEDTAVNKSKTSPEIGFVEKEEPHEAFIQPSRKRVSISSYFKESSLWSRMKTFFSPDGLSD